MIALGDEELFAGRVGLFRAVVRPAERRSERGEEIKPRVDRERCVDKKGRDVEREEGETLGSIRRQGLSAPVFTLLLPIRAPLPPKAHSYPLPHLKNTEGTESMETMVSISCEQPSSAPVRSIFARAGSSGNSTMLQEW